MSLPSRFRVHWVLVNELAVGPAPRAIHHLNRLEDQGVRCILSLCSLEEAPPPQGMLQRFVSERLEWPDHRVDRALSLEDVKQGLRLTESLLRNGPVFVHCLVAMERSPLLCLAWLVHRHGLSPQAALDYLMQVHPGTSPLPGQLGLLAALESQA